MKQDVESEGLERPAPIAENDISEGQTSTLAITSEDQDSSSAIKVSVVENCTVEKTETKKVAVSVHNERTLTNSYSLRSSEVIEIPKDIVKTPEYNSASVIKSTSGDNQANLGTPVSATEVAAALLGASTTSLPSIPGSNFRRHRRVGIIDEDDLSTPYNHYRCLSPNEHGLFFNLIPSGPGLVNGKLIH